MVTGDEYNQVKASNKFEAIKVVRVINHPNGQPGFYLIKLNYVEGVDQIFAVEKEARRALLETALNLNGVPVQVKYSRLDMGVIELVFDKNPRTLLRGLEANPWVIEMVWPQAQKARGVKVNTGSTRISLTVKLSDEAGKEVFAYQTTFQGTPYQPETIVDWGEIKTFNQARLEFWEPNVPEPTHIHIWEIELINEGGG